MWRSPNTSPTSRGSKINSVPNWKAPWYVPKRDAQSERLSPTPHAPAPVALPPPPAPLPPRPSPPQHEERERSVILTSYLEQLKEALRLNPLSSTLGLGDLSRPEDAISRLVTYARERDSEARTRKIHLRHAKSELRETAERLRSVTLKLREEINVRESAQARVVQLEARHAATQVFPISHHTYHHGHENGNGNKITDPRGGSDLGGSPSNAQETQRRVAEVESRLRAALVRVDESERRLRVANQTEQDLRDQLRSAEHRIREAEDRAARQTRLAEDASGRATAAGRECEEHAAARKSAEGLAKRHAAQREELEREVERLEGLVKEAGRKARRVLAQGAAESDECAVLRRRLEVRERELLDLRAHAQHERRLLDQTSTSGGGGGGATTAGPRWRTGPVEVGADVGGRDGGTMTAMLTAKDETIARLRSQLAMEKEASVQEKDQWRNELHRRDAALRDAESKLCTLKRVLQKGVRS